MRIPPLRIITIAPFFLALSYLKSHLGTFSGLQELPGDQKTVSEKSEYIYYINLLLLQLIVVCVTKTQLNKWHIHFSHSGFIIPMK